MRRRPGKAILFATLSALAFVAAGCGPLQLQSSYRRDPVTIDGSETDWKDDLVFVEDLRAYVGVRNDEHDLYLCFICQDHATARLLLGAGLTLWFDPKGGKEHHLGVHFPTGMTALTLPGSGRRGGGRGAGAEGGGDEGAPPAPRGEDGARGEGRDEGTSPRMLAEALKQVEVIGASQFDRKAYEVGKAPGIEVAAGNPAGAMVVEMRIPLAPGDSTAPYGVGVKPGATFTLGIDTGEFPSFQGGGRRSGGGGEGGEGGEGGFGGGGGGGRGGFGGGGRGGGRGGFGGGGGGRGGGGGGARPQNPDPIHEWVKITLAAAPGENSQK